MLKKLLSGVLSLAMLASVSASVIPAGADDAVKLPFKDDALAVYDTRINLYTLEGFRAGRFEIQDLASQEIGLVCAPRPGER